jgi:hypothetical protein
MGAFAQMYIPLTQTRPVEFHPFICNTNFTSLQASCDFTASSINLVLCHLKKKKFG